jgi:hypothetical protein
LGPLLYALIATQFLATTNGATVEDKKRWRAVCDKTLLYVAAGILSGTLYALYNLDGAPSDLKVTSVIADLATIGGIIGLCACMPYNIRMTKRALARLRIINKKYWMNAIETMVVIGLLTGYKMDFLLPFMLHPFA